ncbi:MAG: hypothetical protein ABSD41_09250 [Candidatus Bathyarchaeia archaeon]
MSKSIGLTRELSNAIYEAGGMVVKKLKKELQGVDADVDSIKTEITNINETLREIKKELSNIEKHVRAVREKV